MIIPFVQIGFLVSRDFVVTHQLLMKYGKIGQQVQIASIFGAFFDKLNFNFYFNNQLIQLNMFTFNGLKVLS